MQYICIVRCYPKYNQMRKQRVFWCSNPQSHVSVLVPFITDRVKLLIENQFLSLALCVCVCALQQCLCVYVPRLMKALEVSFVPVDPHIKVLSQYKNTCPLINPLLCFQSPQSSVVLQKMMFQMIMFQDPNSLLTFVFSLSYARSLSLSLYKTWRVSLSTRGLPAALALLLSHLWPPNTTCSYSNNSCYSSSNKHRSLLHR